MTSKATSSFETPMMKQYFTLKSQYPDCILLYRLGDFYEMFLDDAKLGAELLNITLTTRDRGKDGRVPMAGVPYHAIDSYLSKLVKAGYKVAICEQLSDPSASKLVDRGVVRIVTPGTLLDDTSLEKKENNFIVSLDIYDSRVGLAVADISTGHFQVAEYPRESLSSLISNDFAKFSPSECVLPEELYKDSSLLKLLKTHRYLNIFPYFDWEIFAGDAHGFLAGHFNVSVLSSFGLPSDSKSACLRAAAGLLGYLKYTQKDKISHIKKIVPLHNEKYVALDRSTLVNLEVFSTLREGNKKGSFINFLDKTKTSMGGRMLRSWVLKPLVSISDINTRYDVVNHFMENISLHEGVQDILQQITDFERTLSRLSVGIGTPKDLVSLKRSLEKVQGLTTLLEKTSKDSPLKSLGLSLASTNLKPLADLIGSTICDEPPFDPKAGGLIKDGVLPELDKLRRRIKGSKEFISKLEIKERKRTGITSLKVRFNQVFGYYIEITRSNLHLVPNDYVRKQTLVNAERFITPELKEHEDIILTADETIKKLEYNKFLDVVDKVISYAAAIQDAASVVAELDCLQTFAALSKEKNYVRPELTSTGVIHIKQGRHPVVEETLGAGKFVPNDVLLNTKEHQLLIITGPNMAGKSVYIRQVAIIVLMAQLGCYVPAAHAEISVVDKVFVRSGASDVISMGLSTFMVEMVETANILNNATKDSLIIMDEIGRGTSTYDGISIAWSVAEYLVSKENLGAKTLFATHYHELQDLEKEYPSKIRNYQILVEEDKGEPVFLHKVSGGGAGHSFGIAVARLAGIPEQVCTRATAILKNLKERSHLGPKENKLETFSDVSLPNTSTNLSSTVSLPNTSTDSSKSYIFERLSNVDVSSTTPLAALNILAELKKFLQR